MSKDELVIYIYNKMSQFGTPDMNVATKNANILYSIYGNSIQDNNAEIMILIDFILNKVLKNSD